MEVLFPPGRRMQRSINKVEKKLQPFDAAASLKETYKTSDMGEMISRATELVLALPSVASKMFLITIGDRVSTYQPRFPSLDVE
jgi:phosphoribosylformylglycinamidine synthase